MTMICFLRQQIPTSSGSEKMIERENIEKEDEEEEKENVPLRASHKEELRYVCMVHCAGSKCRPLC